MKNNALIDGDIDMKVYDKLLDRHKWKATKDSSDIIHSFLYKHNIYKNV